MAHTPVPATAHIANNALVIIINNALITVPNWRHA